MCEFPGGRLEKLAVLYRRARPCLKFVERLNKLSRQGPYAIENSLCERLRCEIAGGEHFQPRIEIVDVMERHRFRSFWNNRRSELLLTMMRANEMQEVKPHILGRRGELFPALRVFGAQSSPEQVHQFEADGDVSDQFAAFVVVHDETVFR